MMSVFTASHLVFYSDFAQEDQSPIWGHLVRKQAQSCRIAVEGSWLQDGGSQFGPAAVQTPLSSDLILSGQLRRLIHRDPAPRIPYLSSF